MTVYKAATPCISPDAIANQTGIDKEKVCKCLKALGEIGIINPICIAVAEVSAEIPAGAAAEVESPAV